MSREEKALYEQMGGTYTEIGGLLYLDIEIDDVNIFYGKYGDMWKKYMMEKFDKNSPYLATKKIGKNNPMEEQIKADNEVRMEWNRAVDRAIVSGVPEENISKIKKAEITEKVRDSIDLYGDRLDILASIIKLVIAVLELLINRIMLAAVSTAEKVLDTVPVADRNIEVKIEGTLNKLSSDEKCESEEPSPDTTSFHPAMSSLAAKYLRLQNVYDELQKQNEAIFMQEHNRSELEIELSECNGVFKSGKRAEIQKRIEELDKRIDSMKRYGYDNVRDFYSAYYAAKGEYADYMKEAEKWNSAYGEKNENIPNARSRTENYQIDEEQDFTRHNDKKYPIRKR